MTKGRKRTKGVPDLHDELKTRVNLSLTPKAVEGLDARAAELLVSRSELVERIGRGLIPIAQAQLTSVPFKERQDLPDRPGIGLLVSGSQILYVGQGIELKRLESSRLAEFDTNDTKLRVAWIECSEASWLPLIANALVAVYRPGIDGHQSSVSEAEHLSKWMNLDVLNNLPLDILLNSYYVLLEALALRGFLTSAETPSLDDQRDEPAGQVPISVSPGETETEPKEIQSPSILSADSSTTDISDMTVGSEEWPKLTTIFEYWPPPPRWLKSINGGMYEVSLAFEDDSKLHELPEDLQQRILELRLLESPTSTREQKMRKEQPLEASEDKP